MSAQRHGPQLHPSMLLSDRHSLKDEPSVSHTFLKINREPVRTNNKVSSSAPPNMNLNINHNTNPSMVLSY